MIPKLIHPQRVTIQNIDRANTKYDDVFLEAETTVKHSPPFTIKAQVRFNSFDEVNENAYGFHRKGDGYLLVYPADAKRIGKGATILAINDNSVRYFITDITPVAHYNRAGLWKAYFRTKEVSVAS